MLTAIKDAFIRYKLAMHTLPLDQFSIRVARTAAEYEDAFALVHAAYVFMGIQERPSPGGMRIVAQHPLRESTVFVAYDGPTLAATMTVIQDSPVGLPLDKDYPTPLRTLRDNGASLVEYASLAVVQRYWRSGVTQLLSMAAYNFAYNHLGATHTVAGINPRAAPFYRAIFDFRTLGTAHTHNHLAAPVVGLVQDMVAVQHFVRAKYTKPMSTGVRPLEHFVGQPPPCVTLPPRELTGDALMRWKLPREVFQELFLRRSNHIATLTQDVMEQLQGQRSRETLTQPDSKAFIGEDDVAALLDEARRHE